MRRVINKIIAELSFLLKDEESTLGSDSKLLRSVLSVSRLMEPIRECLYLVHAIKLPDYGTLGWQVEQCGRFMGTREMLILLSSFQMAIDLELAQMMEPAGYLT